MLICVDLSRAELCVNLSRAELCVNLSCTDRFVFVFLVLLMMCVSIFGPVVMLSPFEMSEVAGSVHINVLNSV